MFQATPEFLQMIGSKVGLMIAYDDNDSARREEVLAVTRFEGAAIGTKTSGVNKQVKLLKGSPFTFRTFKAHTFLFFRKIDRNTVPFCAAQHLPSILTLKL